MKNSLIHEEENSVLYTNPKVGDTNNNAILVQKMSLIQLFQNEKAPALIENLSIFSEVTKFNGHHKSFCIKRLHQVFLKQLLIRPLMTCL